MLVLTRKLDEAIRIGDDIKITILRVKGNTVRIGIEAPRDVRVVRDELEASDAAKRSEGGDATGELAPAVVRTESLAHPELCSDAGQAGASARPAPSGSFELLASERPIGREEGAVVTTIVDSPQPDSTRLYVGKVRVSVSRNRISEHAAGDQAAPLRAFLRRGERLQAAG